MRYAAAMTNSTTDHPAVTDALPELAFREQHHGGLGWEMRKLTNDRSVRARVRSNPDIKLMDSMDVDQEIAFNSIKRAHDILNAGLGAKVQNFHDGGKVSGTGSVEFGATLLAHYKAWRELCRVRGISGLMAEDVIIWGLSLRESDETRQMRKGTARSNLFKCLDAWLDVRDGDIKTILSGRMEKPLDRSGVTKASSLLAGQVAPSKNPKQVSVTAE